MNNFNLYFSSVELQVLDQKLFLLDTEKQASVLSLDGQAEAVLPLDISAVKSFVIDHPSLYPYPGK